MSEVKDISEETTPKQISTILEEQGVPSTEIIPKTELLLKLGDIIFISDPSNEILNDNTFIIEYIDENKMKLTNVETFEKTTLFIKPDGIIGDGTISELKVLSSNTLEGYAKQNDLTPNKWVNIYFNGEFPGVIIGQITNQEEDMIEIKTTDNDTIYINFDYKGIPEYLPIETFEIRPAPEFISEKEKEEEPTATEYVELGEEELEEQKAEEAVKQIPTVQVKQQIKKLLMEADQIEFGDVVNVQEFVTIDKEKYRFNLETQTNELLNEMLSTIPNAKRTKNVLNSIHIMITRFIQLREQSSNFDNNKNIIGVVRKTAEDKPLANYLSEFKNNLYWIMMVAKNIKKTYVEDKEEGYSGDTINLNEGKELLRIQNIVKNYKSKDNKDMQNKYVEFYSSLNPYMTPFENIPPENSEDVYASSEGIIVEGEIKSDINAIIDNLGDLHSSIVSNTEVASRKFIIQRYNLGLNRLEAASFKGPKMNAQRVKLTKNDQIAVKSVLTLPEPTIRFSQINLPGSSLLIKSNLNLHFLNYWQLLKQNTNYSQVDIDALDDEIDYTDENFVDNIKNYMLNLTDQERPIGLTNLDIYKNFLNIIIPKIRVLFKLVKKYIKGKLSMVDLITYLEPFLVYPMDLTYMNYREINKFIYEKIREYNSKYVEYSRAFGLLKNIKSPKGYTNPLFQVLDKGQNKDTVFEEYGFTEDTLKNITPSEFIRKITMDDYGNLFNKTIVNLQLSLMYPDKLNAVFDMDKEAFKKKLAEDQNNDTCKSYIIAKKYYSMDKLTEDNNQTIYFDKEYDTTDYDILTNKYKKESSSLQSDELLLYLTEEFMKKQKKDEKTAKYMAETLVNGARKVLDGQYAILANSDENNPVDLQYYIRKDNVWQLAEDVDPKWFIRDDDILCNIQKDCLYNTQSKEEEKCESMEVSKDVVRNNTLKQILDQFDKSYNISKEELEKLSVKYMQYYYDIIYSIRNIKKYNFYKYNNQQYQLGLTINEEALKKVRSPYENLRDIILGQSDFVKKQNDILSFVNLYCRPGNPNVPNIHDGEMENEWWMYCIETDTKLLPKFRYILANAFISNPNEYNNVLSYLLSEIGKKDEDSDAWVDMHSGEQICSIDFDVSEGYKDGFVDRSRDILERDIGDVMLEQQKEKKEKKLSPEAQIISNMITSIAANMGINLETSREFIIRVVTELLNDSKVIEKEAAYKEREKEAVKQNKKLPEYAKVYTSTFLYLTLGMILIGIQTSIPPIRTRKTFPGCVRSFSGFPFEGEGDNTGLDYLSCVAYQMKDPNTFPWSALGKQDKISGAIKLFIAKFLLPYPEVEQKIKDKVNYLLTNPMETIPEEHSINKWLNFLPPLTRFQVKHLDNISSAFKDDFEDEIKMGSPKQLDKILVLESKIIAYSFAIQEDIQKIIEKKDLLMKSSGQQFDVRNACCNEKGQNDVTTLKYFEEENGNISKYNEIVKGLSNYLKDVNLLVKSGIMLSEMDTKIIFPALPNEFSEETIYRAFIELCNFHSSIPIKDDLLPLCAEKPNYLSKFETIQEKIAKLKRDGRVYNKELFLRLFQIVCRHNIINIHLSNTPKSYADELRKLINKLDDADEETIAPVFRQRLEKLLDSYGLSIQEDTEEMRQMKNYLESTNTKARISVMKFIKKRGKLKNSEFNQLNKFMNELNVWNFDKDMRNKDIKISDDGMYNFVNYYKVFISLLGNVFPNMIINKQKQTLNAPSYWKLSKSDKTEIRENVEKYYRPLLQFYDNNIIINVLNEILNRCKDIDAIAKATPALTSIKVGDNEIYSVFDKRTTTLLFEYYLLQIFEEYMDLTENSELIPRMLVVENKEDDLYSTDFLVERQLRFTETEQEFIRGDINLLQEDVAKLLIEYIKIMMESKDVINISYDTIMDKVFKLKEAEKNTFTDRLKSLTEEERQVDTILKMNKLGPVWSKGLRKWSYDPDNTDDDKILAEKIAEVERKIQRNKDVTKDNLEFYLEDELQEMETDALIEEEEYGMGHINEDNNDGNYYGDEQEDMETYY
jgi:hypothetical protein